MQLFSLVTLALAATAVANPDAPIAEQADVAVAAREAAVSEGAEDALLKRLDRGSYKVSGLGNRKKAILDAGGNTLDLAIAMLETEDMSASYPYGDGKTRDAADFGLFKQNWGMLRSCAWRYGFKGQSQDDWNNGSRLNGDIDADIASRWDCQEYYGYDKWFAGHRNGAAGLKNPNTQDIMNYKSIVQWIQKQIDSNPEYKTDDTRFWVNVVAI